MTFGPTVVWTTSDANALPVNPGADDNGRTCVVGTPLDSGSGTVTVTTADNNVRNADIKITYTAPVQGQMNLSAGLPQED